MKGVVAELEVDVGLGIYFMLTHQEAIDITRNVITVKCVDLKLRRMGSVVAVTGMAILGHDDDNVEDLQSLQQHDNYMCGVTEWVQQKPLFKDIEAKFLSEVALESIFKKAVNCVMAYL